MNPYASQQNTTFRPGSAAVVTSVVELRISCRDLKDLDVSSVSDPMCVVFLRDRAGKYQEYFRTEVVKNTTNPDFVNQMTITYNFEVHQLLRFDIYDSDSSCNAHLSHHDYLGRMECSLGEILAVQGNQFKRNLTGPGHCGSIIVYGEEVGETKKMLRLQFSAVNLDKKDFLGKSDPYLVISKCNEDSSTVVVHKTEVIKNNLNPVWRHFDIPLRAICSGDIDRTIKFQCYDYDDDGDHDLIGEFATNVRTLMKGHISSENTYEIINPKKKAKKKSYKNSGSVRLLSYSEFEEQTFLDFIRGGTQINFTVAIDFTGSNGDPKSPSSLHFINPNGQPNAYTIAIRAVGDIVADYDSDKMFPALGFGAKLPPHGQISHEFFLNGNPSNPYCAGIDGILQAYYNTINVVQLYGPTNFAPVINHVARFAEAAKDGANYFVLLIITDGAISDMHDTKKAIIHASSLPMSLIIIGVGAADFQSMEELDADHGGLRCNDKVAERDIVQFVPLQDIFAKAGAHFEDINAKLAKEVLAEIPNQLVAYMRKNSIVAKSPKMP